MKINPIPVYVTVGSTPPQRVGQIVFEKSETMLDMGLHLADILEATAVEIRKQMSDADA